jgi:adenine-specific DNA-methyltransferase
MERIEKGHPMSQSTDFVAQNIETLKSLFPTIVKEGKIDMKELQALLGDEIETEEENYRFTWAGKSMARREANKPSTATLRPVKESSKDWDTTQNIFIEGDNLEVLKLLQKSYANKIKMIYIDPPYNTGKDFVYKDNYNDNLGNYLAITGQVDEDGKRISTNSESDGRYHSNWLNMIYPRLKLARNILTEDGAIFISISDIEITNLKKICDEIFGEENFVVDLIWTNKEGGGSSDATHFRVKHEHILCYAKNLNLLQITGTEITNEERYKEKDEFVSLRGPFYLQKLGMGSIQYSESLDYPIKAPDDSLIYPRDNNSGKKACWRWSISKFEWGIQNGFVSIKQDSKGQWTVYTKQYLNCDNEGNLIHRTQRPSGIIDNYSSTQASKLLDILGLSNFFSYSKPFELISFLINRIDGNSFYVLDFFAGSGTTAQAVIQMNAEDGGNRKYICVQLPEPIDEKDEASKDGYKFISEITKERIRRAGEKIKSELQVDLFSKEGKTLDVGFRAFKLDSSNIRAWDGNPDALEDNLFNAGSNIKENRTEEDVLYEILLKYGLDLTMPIEQKKIAGKQVFNIGMGALFICLGDNINTAVAEGIGKWKDEQQPATSKVIFKDTGFTDVEKTNSMQILKRFGIVEVNTI